MNESCFEYLNYLSKSESENKQNGVKDINNKTSKIQDNKGNSKPNANNFKVFRSPGNSCIIGEKLTRTILSAKAYQDL